jgi:hypothetical protein
MLAHAARRTPSQQLPQWGGRHTASPRSQAASTAAPAAAAGAGSELLRELLAPPALPSGGATRPFTLPGFDELPPPGAALGSVTLGVAWPGLSALAWVRLPSPPSGGPSSGGGAAPTLADAVLQARQAIRHVVTARLSAEVSARVQAIQVGGGGGDRDRCERALGALEAAAHAALDELDGRVLATGDLRAVAGGVLYPLDTPLPAVRGGDVLQLLRLAPPAPPHLTALGEEEEGEEETRGIDGGGGPEPLDGEGDGSSGEDGDGAPRDGGGPAPSPGDSDETRQLLPSLGSLAALGYATEPPMALLRSLPASALCAVPDFAVYRPGCGGICWPGATDVRALALDAIVRIECGDVMVYRDAARGGGGGGGGDGEDAPDDDDSDEALAAGITLRRPPVGSELNKPAIVELEGVWPDGADAPPPGGAVDAAAAAAFEAALRAHCATIGATFSSYDAAAGTWVFELPHFEPPAGA